MRPIMEPTSARRLAAVLSSAAMANEFDRVRGLEDVMGWMEDSKWAQNGPRTIKEIGNICITKS